MFNLTVAGFVISVLTIGLSLYIASTQKKQLDDLEVIGDRTRETVEKLRSDARYRRIVKDFFLIGKKEGPTYKVVFPVRYDKKPLPSIFAGDYYTLHVIQSILGSKHIELVQVCEGHANDDVKDSDVIYLCTPWANELLKAIAPPLDENANISAFGDERFPCWFSHVGESRVIRTSDRHVVNSDAEEAYSIAKGLGSHKVFTPISSIEKDYAIVARLTVSNRKIIVVAGIHQYGTWAGGEFFHMLADKKYKRFENIFLSERDFVAILYGYFEYRSFSISGCGIHDDCVWVKDASEWQRFKDYNHV